MPNTRSSRSQNNSKMDNEEKEEPIRENAVQQIVMTSDMFATLLSTIKLSNQQQNVPIVNQPINPPIIQNNFANCKARYGGNPNENVEAFIDSITTYKDCMGIIDVHAVRGFSMLLIDNAATWWQGVKSTINTFQEATNALQHAFGCVMPPWQIYQKLFSNKQNLENTDIFVSNARALLSRLEGHSAITEHVQIDLIYGLLNHRIKTKVTRDSINTFKELIEAARTVEQTLNYGEREKSKVFDKIQIKNKIQCSFCKNIGHSKEECRKFSRQQGQKPKIQIKDEPQEINNDYKQQSKALVCYGCNTPGYIKSNCPKCNNKSPTNTKTVIYNSDFLIANITEAKKNINSRPIVPVEINNRHGLCFLDSGSQCNMAGEKLANILEEQNIPFEEKMLNMTLADGKTSLVDAKLFNVTIGLGDRYHSTIMVSIPKLTNTRTLLGAEFLGVSNILIDMHNNAWFYGDKPNNKFFFYEDPISVNKTELSNEEASKILNLLELREDEVKDLQPNQIEEVNEFLSSNSEIFELSTEPTPFIEHRIQLNDDLPVAVPAYKLSEKSRENLKKEIDELINNDVIEECESPYAAPVILIPKKDGSLRLTVDYRKLNAKTRPDRYPLPRIDDTLQATRNVKIISTLDMKAGYHQVSVRNEDRDKTAFVCPFGTYRYKRMPFGLCNAPATFQRLIDRFRSGLQDIQILAYLDDIIILSQSFDAHLVDLQKVFQRLNFFKLKLNRKKCKFCCTTVKYLGHVISPAGIAPDPAKIQAIAERVPPKNIKQLLSFIQTCSWYRRFIENFAEIARPLTSLTKKNAKWKWDADQVKSFDELKRRLTADPILRQSDPTAPYTVKTDASAYALGACLLQGEGADEKPIEYASRLLLPAEINYTTTEREALAVVWAVTNKFRGYLECATINIKTDHQPLRWLMTLKTPSGRLARWALALQPFNINIDYLPGKSNVIADMLSRPVLDENVLNLVSVELPHKSALEIRNEQLSDPDVEKIIKCFENTDDDLNFSKWTDRGYVLENGILYRYVPDMDEDEAQLVIPKAIINDILKENHDNPLSGHYGVERTYQKIARKYYWTGMRRNIADYISKCLDCQRYKATNLKPAGLLQTPALAQRFEIISIDLFGPLPETYDKYNWIFIIEDTASRWVELLPLKSATAENCARQLIDEVILRYGVPRKVISDNGVQFVSSIMQQVAHCLGFKQKLIPVYHPESNPVERKNRDMKTQLAILVQNNHNIWKEKLPSIRFAMNTSRCQSTGFTPAYLTFSRELRTPFDVNRDLRSIIQNENFATQILPYLKTMVSTFQEARDINEKEQDRNHKFADMKRREGPKYKVGDKVLINSHGLSDAAKGITKKFFPKRDGPYVVTCILSPTTMEIAHPNNITLILGKYHVSELTPFVEKQDEDDSIPQPVNAIKKRGRPPKNDNNQNKQLICENEENNTIEMNDENSSVMETRCRRIVTKPKCSCCKN